MGYCVHVSDTAQSMEGDTLQAFQMNCFQEKDTSLFISKQSFLQ